MTLKTLCFGVRQDGINAYFIIFVETLNTGAVRAVFAATRQI